MEKQYQTGVDPQMTYETLIHGASPTEVKTMRSIAVKVLRPIGLRASPFVSIAWRLGANKDPGVSAPIRQVKLWIQLWRKAKKDPRMRANLQKLR